MPLPTLSPDELVASLRRSSLPTILCEGRSDMTMYRWLECRLKAHNANVLPCGGRSTLLEVYQRRSEYAHLDCAWLADKDLWLFTGVPADYDEIVWTRGYSIENDVLSSGTVEQLLDGDEELRLSEQLEEVCRWFAFEVDEFRHGRPARVDIHPNQFLPLGSNALDAGYLTNRGFHEPPKRLATRIKRKYRLELRGKTLLDIYVRFLSARGRNPKYSKSGLLEISVKLRGNRCLQTLCRQIESALAVQNN